MKPDEQRTQVRIKSKGRFELQIEGHAPIPGVVRNVSPSGVCLETKTAVAPGVAARLNSEVFTANGVVRHCRRSGEVWLVGIELLPPAV